MNKLVLIRHGISVGNQMWITTDKDNRAYESNSYTHEELLKMLEYASLKSTEYNKHKVKKLTRE